MWSTEDTANNTRWLYKIFKFDTLQNLDFNSWRIELIWHFRICAGLWICEMFVDITFIAIIHYHIKDWYFILHPLTEHHHHHNRRHRWCPTTEHSENWWMPTFPLQQIQFKSRHEQHVLFVNFNEHVHCNQPFLCRVWMWSKIPFPSYVVSVYVDSSPKNECIPLYGNIIKFWLQPVRYVTHFVPFSPNVSCATASRNSRIQFWALIFSFTHSSLSLSLYSKTPVHISQTISAQHNFIYSCHMNAIYQPFAKYYLNVNWYYSFSIQCVPGAEGGFGLLRWTDST